MAYGYHDPLRKRRPSSKEKPARPASRRDNSGQVDIVAYFSQRPKSMTRIAKGLLAALRPKWPVPLSVHQYGAGPRDSAKSKISGTVESTSFDEWCTQEISDRTSEHVSCLAKGLFEFGLGAEESGTKWLRGPVYALLTIEEDWFYRWTNASSDMAIIQEIVDVLAGDDHCYQAIVHPDYRSCLNWGSHYHESPLMPMLFGACVEHTEWMACGAERESRLRCQQWGNYLGPALASRLPKHLDKQYLSLETEDFGVGTQVAKRYPNGGLFLTASGDPLEALEEHPDQTDIPLIRNAVWLRGQYRKAGLL